MKEPVIAAEETGKQVLWKSVGGQKKKLGQPLYKTAQRFLGCVETDLWYGTAILLQGFTQTKWNHHRWKLSVPLHL